MAASTHDSALKVPAANTRDTISGPDIPLEGKQANRNWDYFRAMINMTAFDTSISEKLTAGCSMPPL